MTEQEFDQHFARVTGRTNDAYFHKCEFKDWQLRIQTIKNRPAVKRGRLERDEASEN